MPRPAQTSDIARQLSPISSSATAIARGGCGRSAAARSRPGEEALVVGVRFRVRCGARCRQRGHGLRAVASEVRRHRVELPT
eukprot:scaffold104341_cov75-Phaeocystis_antarctica.AAC.1